MPHDNVVVTAAPATAGFTDVMVRQMFFDKVMSMRADNLIVALRLAGLRNQFVGDPLPEDATLTGHNGLSPKEVLSGLRVQLSHFLHAQEQPVRRRVRYMFQTQLMPRPVRQQLASRMSMTFLPGGDEDQFRPDVKFYDVERLEIASMGVRMERQREFGNARRSTHFDFRVAGIDIDRQAGKLLLGGIDEDKKINRVKVSSSLIFEIGSHQLALPEERVDHFDQAIEMLEQMEMAESMQARGQLIPRFPQVFLGFRPDVAVTLEPSEGLKTRAYSRVLAWLRNGSPRVSDDPDFGWATGLKGDLVSADPWSLSGWDAIERIDTEDANMILLHTWQHGCHEFEGLHLVPAAFFEKGSPQMPFKSAARVFVDMEHFMNRRRFDFDGKRQVVPTQAKIQKLWLVEPEVPPYGEVGLWQYDLGCGSPGLEEMFR